MILARALSEEQVVAVAVCQLIVLGIFWLYILGKGERL